MGKIKPMTNKSARKAPSYSFLSSLGLTGGVGGRATLDDRLPASSNAVPETPPSSVQMREDAAA